MCQSLVSLTFFLFFFQLLQNGQCLFEIKSTLFCRQQMDDFAVEIHTHHKPHKNIAITKVNGGFVRTRQVPIRCQKSSVLTIVRLRICSSLINRSWIPWKLLLLNYLLQLVGKIVFLISRLLTVSVLTVSVSVKSSFLYVAVKNGKEINLVLDELLIVPCFFLQQVPAIPRKINILGTALWVPCRAIHTIRFFQHPNIPNH